MVFSSFVFLCIFLPAVFLLYCVIPSLKAKNALLIAASLVFYAYGEPIYVLLMIGSSLFNYLCARWAAAGEPKRKKAALVCAVAVNIGALAVFKYSAMLVSTLNAALGVHIPVPDIALPIGISFFTFQALSYVIDVYRGTVEVQKNYFRVLLYISFFPQLIAGPIVRYSDIEKNLKRRKTTLEDASEGMTRFSVGLAKKILLANSAALIVSEFKAFEEKTVLFYWLYAAAYMLHIYFDFSGYSDMAIGLGRVFGFRFSENFNYPYISASITEFWRRWHISLGGWFRDYLYIPLGGNRVKPIRHVFNIIVVWAATGFWHGASWNFILWGLLYAVLLLFEKYVLPVKYRFSVPMHIYTLFFLMLGFVLFDSANVGEALLCFKSMFGFAGIPVANTASLYYLRSNLVLLVIAAIGATPLPKRIYEKIGKTTVGGKVLAVLTPAAAVASVAVCTAYLIDGSFNPFVYFRF